MVISVLCYLSLCCSVNLKCPIYLSPFPKCHSVYSSTQLIFLLSVSYKKHQLFLLSVSYKKTLARGKETKASNKPLVPMTWILKISQQFLLFSSISLFFLVHHLWIHTHTRMHIYNIFSCHLGEHELDVWVSGWIPVNNLPTNCSRN